MKWIKKYGKLNEAAGGINEGPFTNEVSWDESLLGRLFNFLGGKLRNKNAKDNINKYADELLKLLQEEALKEISEDEKKEINEKIYKNAIATTILELRERSETEIIEEDEFEQFKLEAVSKLEGLPESEETKLLSYVINEISKKYEEVEKTSNDTKDDDVNDYNRLWQENPEEIEINERSLETLLKLLNISVPEKTDPKNIEKFMVMVSKAKAVEAVPLDSNTVKFNKTIISILENLKIYTDDIKQIIIKLIGWIIKNNNTVVLKSLKTYVSAFLTLIKKEIGSSDIDSDIDSKEKEETKMLSESDEINLEEDDEEEVNKGKMNHILSVLGDKLNKKLQFIKKNNKLDPKYEKVAKKGMVEITPETVEKIVELFSKARKSIIRNLGGISEDKRKVIVKNYEKLAQSSDMYKNIASWTQWEERVSKIATKFQKELKAYKNGVLLEFFLNSVDDEHLLNFNKLVRNTIVKEGIIPEKNWEGKSLKTDKDDIKVSEDVKVKFSKIVRLTPKIRGTAIILDGELTERDGVFNNGDRKITCVVFNYDKKTKQVWVKFKIDSFKWIKAYISDNKEIINLEQLDDKDAQDTYFGVFTLPGKDPKINIKYGELNSDGNEFQKMAQFDLNLKQPSMLLGVKDEAPALAEQPPKEEMTKDVFIKDPNKLIQDLIRNFN